MLLKVFKNTVLLFVLVGISCGNKVKKEVTSEEIHKTAYAGILKPEQKGDSIIVGANRIEAYLKFLTGRRIGVVANQTSVIFKNNWQMSEDNGFTHLVDSLIGLNINIKKVFAPEHGFRGIADAGELVKDGIDSRTGLPIVSLYGKNKKPSTKQLEDLDAILFDIQDVGVRFYTYISTLHYVMEACAEANIPLIVLDRPNPNAHYVDGPILELKHKSFVGMHPIPVVHGMTIGEYAQMINGERWLNKGITCDITVINVKNYTHQTTYSLPIKPSPNLPNDVAINLYPSLCFFEGTEVSIGRGTNKQFQVIGSPFFKSAQFSFTPQPNQGATYPKHEGELCYGYDLSGYETLSQIQLDWLIEFYNSHVEYGLKTKFFNDFFTNLAGTTNLELQIKVGMTSNEIRKSWEDGLNSFKVKRKKYLIYKD